MATLIRGKYSQTNVRIADIGERRVLAEPRHSGQAASSSTYMASSHSVSPLMGSEHSTS